MALSWSDHYAQRVQLLKSSAIRELLKVTEQPDVISFAGGLPATSVLPAEDVAHVTAELLQGHNTQALQYGPTEGYTPLREWVADHLSTSAFTVRPENILITSGSQQALDLVGRLLLDAGDRVLIEAPTYLGALQAWSTYNVQFEGITVDEHGLDLHQLAQTLAASRDQRRPKMLYCMPNFQNPGGVTLSLERRKQLIHLLKEHQLPLIEDNAYAELRFAGDHLPNLLHLAGELDQIIYLGSFSKVLAPGLRLGWIVAPEAVIHKMVQAKQGIDLHTPMLTQMIAYKLVSQNFLIQHVPAIRALYHERRNAMISALQKYCAHYAHWTEPDGGMFLWVTLPDEINTQKLLSIALEQKVAFVPGAEFYPTGSYYPAASHTMRLNFSNTTPERIEEGIARLAQAIELQLTATVK